MVENVESGERLVVQVGTPKFKGWVKDGWERTCLHASGQTSSSHPGKLVREIPAKVSRETLEETNERMKEKERERMLLLQDVWIVGALTRIRACSDKSVFH
jgi:hypothetical protein